MRVPWLGCGFAVAKKLCLSSLMLLYFPRIVAGSKQDTVPATKFALFIGQAWRREVRFRDSVVAVVAADNLLRSKLFKCMQTKANN